MRRSRTCSLDDAPPNAADYLPERASRPSCGRASRVGLGIAYNSELVKNPPKTWMDLTKPEYGNGQIGR